MLRLREWGMSVLPAPYVDNGVEIDGTHWFGDDLQLGYAVYAVAGLKGSVDGTDVDYLQSRSEPSTTSTTTASPPWVGGSR